MFVIYFINKMIVFDENKNPINPADPKGKPTYIFEGTIEDYRDLKKQGKLIINKNVFKIDQKSITK